MNVRLFARGPDAAQMERKLRDFGRRDDHNAIRDEIARLRGQRDAGELDLTDYATRVAELIQHASTGATDVAGPADQARSRQESPHRAGLLPVAPEPIRRPERDDWGESLWTARDLVLVAR